LKSIILFGLFILAACEKSEGIWEQLTDAERDAAREQGKTECLANALKDYEDFKADSNNLFLTLYRNKAWKYEFKEGSNSPTETQKIIVWKVTADNIYFIIQTDKNSTITNRFLKISKTRNSEMVDDLKTKQCDKLYAITQSRYTPGLKILYEPVVVSSTEKRQTTLTHNYSNTLLTYFSVFKLSKKIDFIKSADNTITSTTNYTGTLTALSDEAPAHATYIEYSDSPADPPLEYCVVKYTAGTPNTYSLPYTETCSNPAPAGFDPALEL
jgi:hypothetical protein